MFYLIPGKFRFKYHCIDGPATRHSAEEWWCVMGNLCHSPEEFRIRARLTKEDMTAILLRHPFTITNKK